MKSKYSDPGILFAFRLCERPNDWKIILTSIPDHNVGHDRVTERVDNVRDHSLQHLAELEESWRDTGADLQPLGGNLTDVLAHIAPPTEGVIQQLL